MKLRFQADANLDPDIGLGLQRRQPSLDYRLALGVIPDGIQDPDVLRLAADAGRVLVTNDLRMPKHFAVFVAVWDSPVFFSSLRSWRSVQQSKACSFAGCRGLQKKCKIRSDGCRGKCAGA